MSTPPRRSRPRKPGETIDMTAQRIENESLRPDTADAPGQAEPDAPADPEARLADAASEAEAPPPAAPGSGIPSVEESGIAALGEPDSGDRNAPPAADGTVREETAAGEPHEAPATDARPPEEGEAAPRDPAAADPVSGETAGEEPARERAEGERELDAETILAASEPHAAPPRPNLDYHQTAPHAPAHGPGLGTLIGAGTLGAVLALVIGGALQYAGVLPAARAPDTAQLSQQFAKPGDVQQVATDLNTVRGDVQQLQSALSAGGAGSQAGPSGADFAALADRFNNLEGRLNALSSGTEQGGAAALDPNALKGVTDAANGARDAAAQAKQAADGAGAQAADAKRVADGATQAAQSATQAAGTAQQAAEVAQEAASGALAAAKTNGEAVADIRNRIGAVEETSRRAAAAVSAANLKAAVDRGGPFMAELETYARASGASPAVDALRDFAPDGVPSLATLQADWPDARKAILAALHPADPNAGVGAQILSGFNSLVAVRPSASTTSPTGGRSGEDAAIAALDAKLQAGDLAGWLAGFDALPEAGKAAGADFRRRLEARARSEALVGDALDGAVNSIGTAN